MSLLDDLKAAANCCGMNPPELDYELAARLLEHEARLRELFARKDLGSIGQRSLMERVNGAK